MSENRSNQNKDLTEEEFLTLIRLAKRVLWADPKVRKRIQDHRVNITPANFYSEIPLIDDVYSSFEYGNSEAEVYNHNTFHNSSIREFIDRISVYADEFSPELHGDFENPSQFFWSNPAFSSADAMVYYCILRYYKPSVVLETGSGFSTMVANEALNKNGKGKLVLIEPHPKPFLKKLNNVEQIIESRIQDLPFQNVIKLVEDADIWFIDSTHTVKVGSDCLFIYLKILPQIARDILVHSHDVYLPYGLPIKKVVEKHQYWTEQYLLYAYMLENKKTSVLFGTNYAKKSLPGKLYKLMNNKYIIDGSSIWYQLNGSTNSCKE